MARRELLADAARLQQQSGPHVAVIERDYTCTNAIRFVEQCPVRVQHRIDQDLVIQTVAHINAVLAEAERVTVARLLRNVANMLTLGLIDTFAPSPIEIAMAAVDAYVCQQNDAVFLSRGLRMHTPSEYGMLQIELECL